MPVAALGMILTVSGTCAGKMDDDCRVDTAGECEVAGRRTPISAAGLLERTLTVDSWMRFPSSVSWTGVGFEASAVLLSVVLVGCSCG